PVQYKGANVPQAWAAGSCFCLLSALLGFQPDAPEKKLYLDPALPDWLPDLHVRDLRLNAKAFDIRFWREGEATRWEVTKGDAAMVEPRDFAGGDTFWPPLRTANSQTPGKPDQAGALVRSAASIARLSSAKP
ncbi:MAG TPA: hypothetical protein VFE13_15875, partial [Caulobacteraceae bacterium]|nr:hypothetical protein [Caulobacteraceae bacterium]